MRRVLYCPSVALSAFLLLWAPLLSSACASEVPGAVSPASAVLISEFYACAVAGDEYIVVSNTSPSPVQLGGWRLTDGEGDLVFAAGCTVGPWHRLTISSDPASFLSHYGIEADIGIDDPSSLSLADVVGDLRLGDGGDSLTLYDDGGAAVDSVCYGSVSEPPEGWHGEPLPPLRAGEVVRRTDADEGFVDTDTSSDWTQFRELRYGHTSFAPFEAEAAPGSVTTFVSPDCSLDVVASEVRAARSSVRLCAYELSSPGVVSALLDAADGGAEVTVLVDGSPAGGIGADGIQALSALSNGGVDVRTLSGSLSDGVVRHVTALHSKYVVIDGCKVIVLSENFVPSGVPTDRIFANRGWGVVVEDEPLAGYLAAVFDEDSRPDREDVVAWAEDARFDANASLDVPAGTASPPGQFAPLVLREGATVALYVSPDCSPEAPFLSGLLAGRSELAVEQFQADLLWSTRWSPSEVMSPLLGGVLDSLRDGGSCRMLLDSTWFNADRNGEVADRLTAISRSESLPGEFRMMDDACPVTVLHNKGLVADGSVSVVSSNNWVYASFARNREVAAVIRSPEAAAYFLSVFEADWTRDRTPPTMAVPSEIVASSGDWVEVSSAGCYDDRVVARRCWDLGADGTVDSSAEVFRFLTVVPGEVELLLSLEDAWGNRVSATIVVRTIAPDTASDREEGRGGLLWTAPLTLAALLSAWTVRRSRRPPPGAVDGR